MKIIKVASCIYCPHNDNTEDNHFCVLLTCKIVEPANILEECPLEDYIMKPSFKEVLVREEK